MSENNDEIVIKHKKRQPKEPKARKSQQSDVNYSLYSRIFAILLMLFSVLLFLSIISHTQKDELNAKITISELFSIFSSDSMIRIKAETTHNWLGLLGAILSDLLINGTIGYVIIFLPIFLFIWGIHIFKSFEIPDKLIRNTIIYLLFGLTFSSMLGSIRNFQSFSSIDKEWIGAIGIFIGSVFSKVISPFGATLIFFICLFFIVYFGTNINWKPIIEKTIKFVKWLYLKSIDVFKFLFIKVKDFENINKELLSEEIHTKQSSVEQPNIDQSEQPKQVAENLQIAQNETAEFHKPELKIQIRNPLKEQIPPIKPLGLRDVDIESQYVAKTATEERKAFSITTLEETENSNNEISCAQDENIDKSKEVLIKSKTIEPDTPSVEVIEKSNLPTQEKYFPIEDNTTEPEIDEALIIKPKTEKPIIEEIEQKIIPPKPLEIREPETKPKLVINVEDPENDDDYQLNTPLGVAIHDEEISYTPPSVSLLDTSAEEIKVSDEELRMNARILQEKLETFKIFIENLTVTPGPVVTQYEFVPAAGIKISRIESLADDLAMALKARGIRIIAPIPGRGTIGVEIPNQNPSIVRFSNVVNTTKFYESRAYLPIALGKTISGEVVVADLAKAPHLLIAGSTGSGKSVGINTIIASLLYRMSPQDLKFVIIDPKKVELQQYARLRYHFLAMSPDVADPIVTNPQDAVAILKSTVLEMENRYNILAKVGQRNIADYNAKVRSGAYKNVKDFDHRPMPYIVVIVDELADLMLTASREVEEPIIRLAQMARAVGIHLVIATQRPSVDVITGIIKANFPARIAYLVASKIDSRTILDISGAEQLLGNGDMLFLPSGSPKPIRIQNAFISTDEVENICNFIGKQPGFSKPYMLPSILEEKASAGNISAEDRDPLFEEAARLVIQLQQASVSLIQRRLKVGYARAGRIIDELEDAGIVGPNEGSKARTVLLESESDLERIL